MDDVLVVLGLALLALPVLVIYLTVSHGRLKARVALLETRLAALAQARSIETIPQADLSANEETGTDLAPQPVPDEPRPLSEPVSDAGPWAAARREDAAVPPEDSPPRAIVLRRDRLAALSAWLRDNWFYAVSALSLALAGIFLVQYGMENGLLPPRARVAAALAFGAALIGAGEFIRRRFGDGEDASTAYLPSVFSGAGIVTLFGGILSARLLYDLLGPETALVGLVAVALLALVLGWFHGPLLASVGLVGAFAAPFLVGGESEDATWLLGYFALIAVLGLGVDTVRRWAWVSVLTLVLAYAAGALVQMSSAMLSGAFIGYCALLALIATVIPVRSLRPDHAGLPVLSSLVPAKPRLWPEFPTRVAFGALATSSLFIARVKPFDAVEFWLATGVLAALAGLWIVWSRRAPALQDAALLPLAAFAFVIAEQGDRGGAVLSVFAGTYLDAPEADFPMAVTALVLIAAGLSALAAWRSLVGGPFRVIWAGVAALFAPVVAILLDLFWAPASVIGPYPWALHAAGLAALMVGIAERLARDAPANRLRPALAVLSALSCLAFAFVIVLSSAALTVALVATVAAAAALDRRFNLPAMSLFISLGVMTVGYRLVADPGLDWGSRAALGDVLLAYGGALAGFLAALWLLRPLARPTARVMLDSAAWSTAGLLVSLLLLRWLESLSNSAEESHWAFGIYATIWLGLALAQMQRLVETGALRWIRIALAVVFALIGLAALLVATTLFNPVIGDWGARVIGPPFVNSLAVAYLLPAAVLAAGAWRIPRLPRLVKGAILLLAGALAVGWLVLVIRHFWQGAEAMELTRGMGQPELYTYTVALLLAGAALFYQSLARRSVAMRRAGLAVIALAVAKVFLIDISGLGGLTRVFSLLVLGLSLSGLAWLDRWARQRW